MRPHQQTPLPALRLPDAVGVNIHFVEPDTREVDRLAAGGFGIIRMDFTWEVVERHPGQYDMDGYARLVDAMRQRGIRILFILDYGHPLHDNGMAPHTDSARAAFVRFAEAAASRFRGKDIIWEIWNEPNIGFWLPKPNWDDYAALALAVIPAIRKADPKATIIAPAAAGFGLDFIDYLGKKGVLALLDGVSVHPYRGNEPESALTEWIMLRSIVDRYSGGRVIPLISGEWGYSTGGESERVTEDTQAHYLTRQWLSNLTMGVPVSIWYDWKDDGPDPNEREHRFGTVRQDLTPKPSYTAARQLVNRLRGYTFMRRVDVGDPNAWVLVFRRGTDTALACWKTAGNAALRLPSGSVVQDIYGKTTTRSAQLTLTGAPQTVRMPTGAASALTGCWGVLDRTLSYEAGKPFRIRVQATNPTGVSRRFAFVALVQGQPIARGSAVVPARGTRVVQLQASRTLLDAQGTRVVVRQQGQAAPLASDVMHIVPRYPLSADLVLHRSGDGFLTYRNPGERGIEAQLVIDSASGQRLWKGYVQIPAKTRDGMIRLNPDASAVHGAAWRLATATGAPLVQTPMVRWEDTGFIALGSGWDVAEDGDPKVQMSADCRITPPQPGRPIDTGPAALRVTYQFQIGWRFIRLFPRSYDPAIAGRPAIVGLWVYGDGSGNPLRLRFTDRTGQTFQPQYTELSFTGWRWVSAPLDGAEAGRWGGANDGVVHYPIRWDCPLLIDSNQKSAGDQHTVWFTGLALGYRLP